MNHPASLTTTKHLDATPNKKAMAVIYGPAIIFFVLLAFFGLGLGGGEGFYFIFAVCVLFFGVMCLGLAPTNYPGMCFWPLRAKVRASDRELEISTWGSTLFMGLWGIAFAGCGVWLLVEVFRGGVDGIGTTIGFVVVAILLLLLGVGAVLLLGRRRIVIAPSQEHGGRMTMSIHKARWQQWVFALEDLEQIVASKKPSGSLPAEDQIDMIVTDFIARTTMASRTSAIPGHVQIGSEQFMGLDVHKLVAEISHRAEAARAQERGLWEDRG